MNSCWLDVCLRVSDVRVSREFYESLGFVRVEGDDEAGWAVVVIGAARVGLYEHRYMGQDMFTLNVRGADVRKIVEQKSSDGYQWESPPKVRDNGACSASLVDPDGNRVFFDTIPGEVRQDPS